MGAQAEAAALLKSPQTDKEVVERTLHALQEAMGPVYVHRTAALQRCQVFCALGLSRWGSSCIFLLLSFCLHQFYSKSVLHED